MYTQGVALRRVYADTVGLATVSVSRDPFFLIWINFDIAWISNYIHHNVGEEITYLFQKLNGAAVKVLEGISNPISHITGQMFTYPCWD